MKTTLEPRLGGGSKSTVAVAFRNGPIEDLHAGKPCTVCSGNREISHISDEEMKAIMKSAVNTLYRSCGSETEIPWPTTRIWALGRRHTQHWDDPQLKEPTRKGSRGK
jgi:hypothetical protein